MPARKVLEHILKKSGLTQKHLSEKTGIYPQGISELIKGTRNFTIQQPFDIEKALGIGIEGYFYKIQTNYQVYVCSTEKELTKHPDLSKLSPALFGDTRVDKINWVRNKDWVVRRVF